MEPCVLPPTPGEEGRAEGERSLDSLSSPRVDSRLERKQPGTTMSARLCFQIKFRRTRLSALLFPRFLNPPCSLPLSSRGVAPEMRSPQNARHDKHQPQRTQMRT